MKPTIALVGVLGVIKTCCVLHTGSLVGEVFASLVRGFHCRCRCWETQILASLINSLSTLSLFLPRLSARGTCLDKGNAMLDKDQNLKEKLARLFDRTTYEAMALLLAQPDPEIAQAEPMLEWMTATQLAHYWQIINAEGEPTTAGIMKWAKRSDDEHPLPHACMGDLLRFKREEVDRWAQEEAARRKAEGNRKKLQLAS